MSVPQATEAAAAAAVDLEPRSAGAEAHTRWNSRRLALGRVVWVMIALLTLIMFVASMPARYTQLAQHTGDVRIGSIVPAGDPVRLGIPPDFYATYNLAWETFHALVFFIAGVVLFTRRSANWMLLFTSLAMLTFGAATLPTIRALAEAEAAWVLPQRLLTLIAWVSLLAFIYIFPDGRFVPNWARWAFALSASISIFWNFLPDTPLNPERWPPMVFVVFQLVLWATPLVSQIYRYRRVSGPAQRQQTKWAVYGLVISVSGSILATILGYVYPVLDQPGPERAFYELVYVPVVYLFSILGLSSIAIAVLRYQLWNIDLIINRTLVYVPLTGIVAGLYAASVALFQRLFQGITGQTSDAAIVFSALILASTFTPIKNGLQALVDRRFKEVPDSTKKLRAFNEEMRSIIEVFDLERTAARALEEATGSLQAQSGAVSLAYEGRPQITHTWGEWRPGEAVISVPIESEGTQVGRIQLGPRKGGSEYNEKDREVLGETAAILAQAYRLTRRIGTQ